VAERVAALAEQRLGLGAAQACLERRHSRDLVELEQPIQSPDIQGDRGGEALAARRQAADDRRAAAERDDRDSLLRAHPQHGQNLVVGARKHDRIGRVGGVTGPQ
jgi:hypothetical protein